MKSRPHIFTLALPLSLASVHRSYLASCYASICLFYLHPWTIEQPINSTCLIVTSLTIWIIYQYMSFKRLPINSKQDFAFNSFIATLFEAFRDLPVWTVVKNFDQRHISQKDYLTTTVTSTKNYRSKSLINLSTWVRLIKLHEALQ